MLRYWWVVVKLAINLGMSALIVLVGSSAPDDRRPIERAAGILDRSRLSVGHFEAEARAAT